MKRLLLTLAALIGFAGTAQACPNWSLNPIYGQYNVSMGQLRAGQQLSLTAGGDNNIWSCRNVRPQTDTGDGYFGSSPDARIFVNGIEGRTLKLEVRSNCDSALLINTGTATWYYDDDDAGNLDPQIVLTRPQSGQIDIWVGTYDGAYCDAVLMMSAY
ncbi:hypothetical protein [Thalassorhabdomicrobium marinisediminis]|uniref:Peptidase S1 n=1 Tax=Thalassorhabdomicrobium marinisediminis TaxID=2170577 RepID=A0A2T7G0V9_9RHOB|nr:hypothetical protein [Thalassorhabdomicrobium marinisediminis]PVA08040.1 hypothetical protein DC363_00635 [Thalassorhabdomicrobium marinisediminis]